MQETGPLLPFAETVSSLHEARRRMETMEPRAAAATLESLTDQIDRLRRAVEAGLKSDSTQGSVKTTRIVALRASEDAAVLRQTLQQWFRYYNGYDPMFTWWADQPFKRADKALEGYVAFLRERIVGAVPGQEEPIVGDPIGRDALLADLEREMIPYTPEELIAIGEKEYAWCLEEAKKASREMGLGDDWKAALERVKNIHVEPGRQTDLIRDLAFEAIDFVEKNQLVTVPALARDIWRIEMMAPERQRVNPFFLGGEVIQVSYPTDTMDHADKLMSMRGNALHFSRATVQHELIPGHHLQGFMSERYNTHRAAFRDAVLDGRLGPLLGNAALGQGVHEITRRPDRHAVLAHAPRRAHRLLAQFPPRQDDAAGGYRLSGREGGSRTVQRPKARCGDRSTAPIRRSIRSLT